MSSWDNGQDYWDLGWAPIPLKAKSKEPDLVELAPFLAKRTAPVRFFNSPWGGIGIVTGRPSNLLVLDVDGWEGDKELQKKGTPITPMVETDNGYHLYFRYSPEFAHTFIRLAPGIDLKSNGGYVVAPPSIHPSGKRYAWAPELSPWDVELAEVPQWVVQAMKSRSSAKKHTDPTQLAEPIRDGGRNDTLTQVAGALRRRGLPREDLYVVLQSLNEVRCEPALEREEVARIANNIAQYPPGRKREKRIPSVNVSVTFDPPSDEELYPPEPPVF